MTIPIFALFERFAEAPEPVVGAGLPMLIQALIGLGIAGGVVAQWLESRKIKRQLTPTRDTAVPDQPVRPLADEIHHISQRQDSQDQRLVGIDGRMVQIDGRIGNMERGQIQAADERHTFSSEIRQSMGDVKLRLGKLETIQIGIKRSVEEVNNK